MHWAAQQGFKEVAELLFSTGASVTDKDKVWCFLYVLFNYLQVLTEFILIRIIFCHLTY
jgi:hypothetical protein